MEEPTNNMEQREAPEAYAGGKKSVWSSPLLWIAVIILVGAGAVGALAYTGAIDISKYVPVSGTTSGEAVATVNGETITRADLDERVAQQAQIFANQNQELDEAQMDQLRQQTLQSLINETLILQKADEAGVTVDDADIDQQFNQIASQFESDEAFSSQLDQVGITRDDLRENLRSQLTRDAYLRSEIDLSQASTTDAEVQEAYDNLVAQQGEDANVPPFAQVSGQIKQELQNQKQQQLVSAFVTQLREAADIQTFLSKEDNNADAQGEESDQS